MKSKIFISLDIPEKFKKRLVVATEKWATLPIKWVREANLHITLVFLGFVDEEVIPEICQKVAAAAEKSAAFDLNLEKIELFPSVENPQAIALVGQPNEELKKLVNAIEKKLGISQVEKKSFRAHITLGRLRKRRWEELLEKPEINEKFSVSFSVKSIDIIASHFEGSGSQFVILESCPLS